ncbi:uncharacterized protein LOC116416239 [Nasonia vitripennis]|uniref:RNA-directed DNA polymerase n=1 Tax=Nasonia vitripennis TaxID=7425 RepID=A0A7M7Q2E4_NASVI|nr:uncharacterized protein LOC116416239 [Nasonia vitripennis]
MLGWYSRFIERESELKVPLIRLLRKDQKWEWGDEQQEVFEALLHALTVAPVLARPDFTRPFKVQYDASGAAIGAVLTQDHDDRRAPDSVYQSCTNFCREKLHDDGERVFGSGLGYQKAEAVHRGVRLQRDNRPQKSAVAVEFERSQRSPSKDGQLSCNSGNLTKYQGWRIENGVLYRWHKDALLDPITHREEAWRLVVPEEQKERVIRDAHCPPSSGHLGIEKTYDRVAREYYWRGAYHDVYKFVQSCEECQKYKTAQSGAKGLMGRPVVERPWAIVAADLMEFPPSKNRFKYLVVFQDLFTRWIKLKPLRKADAKSVARAFEELILFRWETPEYFLTDNGKEFDNQLLKKVLESPRCETYHHSALSSSATDQHRTATSDVRPGSEITSKTANASNVVDASAGFRGGDNHQGCACANPQLV